MKTYKIEKNKFRSSNLFNMKPKQKFKIDDDDKGISLQFLLLGKKF